MDLMGRVAIVTGGGTGLGKAIAVALAREGVAVAVNYARSETEARETAREIVAHGGRAIPVKADVSDPRAVEHMCERVATELGAVDVLVNNAGITRYVPMRDLDELRAEDFDRILAVNVKGAFLCAQAAARQMREQGRGKIVSVSSNSAFVNDGSSIPYIVSKAVSRRLAARRREHRTRWRPAG